jgi:DNA-binding response OmpR family regulator
MTPLRLLRQHLITQAGKNITIPRELAENLIIALAEPASASQQFGSYINAGHWLTPIETALLQKLAANPGIIISSDVLLKCSQASSTPSLWVHIKRLRYKLNWETCVIHTVNRQGYIFEERGEDGKEK